MSGQLQTVSAESASLPALIDRAATALSGARSAAEVLEAREMAGVAYDIAKRTARLAKAKGAHDSLIAAAHRAQADAHEIQALASRRLADEYDAAQDRGEVATRGGERSGKEHSPAPPAASDIGLSRKDIHEARLIRDAEAADPGIVRRALDAAIDAGEEPTRAKVRRAVLQTVRPESGEAPKLSRKEQVINRVRDAISALAGLPPAEEVAAYFRNTDAAIIVSEKLPSVAEWIEDFAAAWEE